MVTQVTPAKTFDLPLEPYPSVKRVYDNCMAIPAFADAHPAKQPDAELGSPEPTPAAAQMITSVAT